jgi:outer membrane lipase/esterase
MRSLLTSGLVSVSVLLSATALTPAAAQSFNQAIVFGDSNVDSGWWTAWLAAGKSTGNASKNARISSTIAQGGNGAPVGTGYLMNSQVFASYFGLTAIPANQTGGTNYAIAGAVDAAVPANGNIGNLNNQAPNTNTNLPSTVQQIANYLASTGGVANPNAIYLVSSGGNDLTFANGGAFSTLTAKENYAGAQAANLITALRTLQSAGAQYIIVQNDFGTGTLSNFYNQTLWTNLSAAGVSFIPADRQAMVRAVQSNPTMFGFTAATVVPAVVGSGAGNTASACVYKGPGVATVSGWSQFCLNSATPSASLAYLRTVNAQQTSFFADDQHFSAAGQKIEADYMFSLVTAPSEISYLAEAPVKTRAAVISAIDNQIAISQSQPGQYRAWVTGDVSSLKMTNSNPGFPDDPGTPISATAGFDYRLSPNWLAGLAFSGGTTKQSFSLGGDYTLTEYSVSGYAAYLNGPYWGNIVASAGGLSFDTNRQVPIGITMQPNTGSTKGSNLSLMLETGYNFTTPLGIATPTTAMPVKAAPLAPLYVTHGPVVGITLQRVRVNGFTETDQFSAIGGFTALSFLGQTRDSAVSELGYQANINIGIWKPFAKLVWNHELANTNRDVTAFLTTSTFAPGFSLPAVVFGKDWGTATLGTALKISNNVTGYAAFNSQLAEGGVTVFGGQIGLNVAFGVPTDAPGGR